ncbi:MAG: peptidylprolyl isomerase [Pseudomonadota bacterium]
MKLATHPVLTFLLATTLIVVPRMSFAAQDEGMQTVVSDGGVSITRDEFEQILRTAAPKAVARSTVDMGDRLELINAILSTRRIAAEADKITVEDEGYWDLHFALVAAKRDFVLQKFMESLEIPDLEPLAREYYDTQRDKYALVPEKRASSHILLASRPGLDREAVRAEAATILAELEAGADWDAMVAEHSDDAGSRARNGSLNRWVTYGDPGITPPYTEALFEIDETGGYSRVTDSQFGIHIIRLDGIEESYYRPYEEVRGAILGDVEKEFRQRAARVNRARYNFTDDIFIDGEAMEELFAPYTAQ